MNKNEAQELLPWFVAGTLSADETRAVQAFVDSGEISRQELHELSLFAETVQEQTAAEPAYNTAILDNVMAQLDDVPQTASHESLVVPEPTEQATGGLRAWFAGLRWQLMPPVAKVALVGQFALVLALGAALVSEPASRDTEFTTVSATPPATVADFSMGLQPQTTEAQLRELLGSVGAQIVGGPNSLGMYQVDIGDIESFTEAELTQLRSTLSTHPAVTFLQPIVQ